MKAISLWEPWASLVRTGAKTCKPFGDFSLGRYAWKLKLIKAVEPFPVKGKRRFFEVPR
jgi:hypothetical protein